MPLSVKLDAKILIPNPIKIDSSSITSKAHDRNKVKDESFGKNTY